MKKIPCDRQQCIAIFLRSLLLFFGLTFFLANVVLAESSGVFPRFNAELSSEEKVEFPTALGKNCNIFVISFDDPQQPIARSWLEHLRLTYSTDTVWDMPIVGKQLPFLEGVIRRAIKRERPDIAIQRKTVPLFVSSDPIKTAFQIPNEKEVWIGIVDAEGKVLGGLQGARSVERETQAQQLISSCKVTSAETKVDVHSSPASAASSTTSTSSNIQVLSPQELSLLAKKSRLFIYDCNGPELYAEGHVPGASMMEYDKVTADKLPADKTAQLAFYCYNKLCGASIVAARSAVAMGYTRVFHVPEGIMGWREAGLPLEAASVYTPRP
jgi:rhodanese-related sulfurtransferase